MKRVLSMALAVAVLATASWSCNNDTTEQPTPEPKGLTPNDSYVLGNADTPFVWAGVENVDEDVYTVYLATQTPGWTTVPVSISGLTVTIPASALGAETAFGTGGGSASLDGVALSGGKVKVEVVNQTLTVDVTGAKVGDKAFAANWKGGFTSVTEPGPMDYDYSLNNQWMFDGEKRTITNAEFEAVAAGVYFTLADADRVGSGWTYFENRTTVYLPLKRIGKEILMSDASNGWGLELEMSGDPYIYYTDGSNQIADGKVIVTQKSGGRIELNLVAKFDDGKIFKARYVGDAVDKNNVGIDDADVEYDETLVNQYKYDGKTYNIGWSGLKTASGAAGNAFMMSTSADRNDLVSIALPQNVYEADVRFTENSTYAWIIECLLNGTTLGGQKGEMGDVVGGKVNVNRIGLDISIEAAIEFTDGKKLYVNYSGTAENCDPQGTGSYIYDGGEPVTILSGAIKSYPDDPERSVEFVLSTVSPPSYPANNQSFLRNKLNVVLFMLPQNLFGQEITLGEAHTEYRGSDTYAFAFKGGSLLVSYEGNEIAPVVNQYDPERGLKSGTMKVTKLDTDKYDFRFNVTFNDDKTISGSYVGTMWNASSTTQVFSPDTYGRIGYVRR